MKQSGPKQIRYGWPQTLIKLLRMMKLATFFLFIGCLQVSATAYAQKNSITLSLHDVSLEKAFTAIKQQSGYLFLYNNEKLSHVGKKITLNIKDATIDQVMKDCLKGLPLSYQIINNTIIIIPKPTMLNAIQPVAVQIPTDKVITGVVSDSATGQPLAGVTIKVEDKDIGTVTDHRGRFSLEVADDAVLEVSYLGYASKVILVNGRTTFDIALSATATGLNQLVVVGYGTQKKGDLTGAITAISTKAMQDRPNGQFGYAIEGKAPGVQVLRSSGQPQAGFSIRIRGTSSITSSSEPLYIVDGIPTESTNEINPGDIESISILKDAASAAIYGASGANGVVLITTKRGGNQKAKLSLNVYDGYATVWKHLKVLNSTQYKDLMNDMGQSLDWSRYTANTDWQKELFRTANTQNYQMSVSGGNEKTGFYVSGTWMKQDGVVITNTVNRANFRLNLDHKVNNIIKIGTSVAYDRWYDIGVSENSRNGSIMNAILGSPVIGVWSPNGKSYTTDPFKQDLDNPVALATGPEHNWTNYRFHGNAYAEITILPELKFKSKFGYEQYHGVYNSYADPYKTVDGRSFNGQASRSSSDNQYWIAENTLNYAKSFNQHAITALAGFISSKTVSSSSSISRHNFANPAITTVNGGSVIDGATSTTGERSTTAFISRVTYAYGDKYLAAANFRADASSVFGPENRWGYFPSFSVGWRISNENFFQDIHTVNDLKLRASWGRVGNGNIGAYSYLGTVAPSGSYVIGGNVVAGYLPESLDNLALKWETTQQTDIGLDLSLFNSRVILTADYYYKKTFGLLLNAPVPASSGYTSALKNIGDLRNKGLEFDLATRNIEGEFTWNSDFNISFNRNRVLNIAGGTIFDGPIDQRANASIVRAGLPLGSFYGYIAKGVDPKTGNMVYQMSDPDGLTTDDKTVIGNANPRFIYGFTNDFTYRQWSLTLFIQGVQGNDILNATRIFSEGMWEPRNQLATVLDRWTSPGQFTAVPREDLTNNTTDQPNYNSLISTRFIENGAYLRVKSLSLSYAFPATWINKISLSSLRLYVTAENLLTFTGYSGFDPEVSAFGVTSDGAETNNVAPGVDFGTYPQTRNVIFGLNVTF